MPAQSSLLQRALGAIERAGNRLPHPTLLFVYLCGIMLALSWLGERLALRAVLPTTGETVAAKSLLSTEGLHWLLTHTVTNFTGFAPVGTVLVAMLGLGVAEHSGLLQALLRRLVTATPRSLLTFVVVLASMLSHVTADAGYVVLIPLAGLLFASAGRHPIAGIAAAFAGVSGGYAANFLIGPVDVILAGLSTAAVQLVDAQYTVGAAGNYYFSAASTLLLCLVGTAITEWVVVPRLGEPPAAAAAETVVDSPHESRGLRAVALFTLVFAALLAWGLIPGGALRDPASDGILNSPFLNGIVTLIAVYAALAGIVFGRASGRYTRASEFVGGMENSMAAMASYLVLMFFAAQFVSYFAWSQLGSIAAIAGAQWLGTFEPGAMTLTLGLIALTALLDLLVGSASAKWALLAPVFVPMFYLLGLSPETTQMAYRIGDSTTNIITPLMPYFGVVVAFAQRHDKNVGFGTLIATMLPYSLAFLLSWSLLLMGWIALDLPLGPGAPIALAR